MQKQNVSQKSQIITEEAARDLTTVNLLTLALVARSSSSHCSCRLARIGSICSLVSGLSWSRSSPAYNIPHWFIVNDVLKYIKGLPKLLVIMHKFTKISYYFKILYQEQWTFDNYYISISAWLKLHKTLNTGVVWTELWWHRWVDEPVRVSDYHRGGC
jgi:hypothetical protein